MDFDEYFAYYGEPHPEDYDRWMPPGPDYSEHRARAHNLREAARYIRELEARPSGAIDYERVRELLPELADYADHDIEGVPTILRYVAAVHPTHLQDCGWVGMCSVRGYVQWENGACWLTSKGINAMSIFDACRVEHDPDPAIPEGLSDGALGALLMVAQKPRGLQSELALELGALVCGTLVDSGTASYYEWAPNHTGRALATHLAANMRRKVAEPEPIGYSLPALLGLSLTQGLLVDVVHSAREEGLVDEPTPGCRPTDLGRTVWAEFLRRLGMQEKTATEPEQWSEPVDGMTWARCARLCSAMGSTLRTQHAEKGWKAIVGDIYVPDGGYWETEDRASMAAVRWCADKADRYDRDTDRVRLDGLEVARG
jgi:hypothetical protein